jgi:hypothetical protein
LVVFDQPLEIGRPCTRATAGAYSTTTSLEDFECPRGVFMCGAVFGYSQPSAADGQGLQPDVPGSLPEAIIGALFTRRVWR